MIYLSCTQLKFVVPYTLIYFGENYVICAILGTDGTQSAISVVRVGHEGKPDDATDSENEDDNIPHVTLSVDSYYDEPNSIIKYGKMINVILLIYYFLYANNILLGYNLMSSNYIFRMVKPYNFFY